MYLPIKKDQETRRDNGEKVERKSINEDQVQFFLISLCTNSPYNTRDRGKMQRKITPKWENKDRHISSQKRK